MDIIKKNIEAYDATVDEYYEFTKNLEPPEIIQREDFMKEIKPNGKILDLCCGPGRDSRFLSERGYDVLGVDLSPNMIEKAEKVAPKAKFKVMNLLELDFPPDSFDGVFFCAGLLAVPRKHSFDILKKIHFILADKGVLFISVKEGTGEGFKFRKGVNVEKFYSFYTKEELEEMFGRIGFEILKFYRPEMHSEYHQEQQWIGWLCRKV